MCVAIGLPWIAAAAPAAGLPTAVNPSAAAPAAGLPAQTCALDARAGSAPAGPRDAAASPVSTAPERLTDADTAVRGVLELIAGRLALMPTVAAWKWQHHAPVSDPPRERVVIAAAAASAQSQGLLAPPVERLFALQTRFARELEDTCELEWGTAGPALAGPLPDLAAELRPRLDALTRQQLTALYLAAPVLAQPDFEARYLPMAAEVLSGAAWTQARIRELLTALATVRFAMPATLARVRAAGELRVGTTGDYAPFSLLEGGTLRGADIALAEALAHALGVEAVFVRTSWPTLLADLTSDRFDIAMGGVADTPARRAAAAVSRAYLRGGKTIIARCADAGRFGSLAAVDRPGVRLIVNPGGTNEQFLHAHVRRASIRIEPDNTAIFEQIRAGRADAMITDDVEVQWQTRRHPDLCRSYPGLLTHADKVVLLTRDPELIAAVDRFIADALAERLPEQLLQQSLTP